MNNKKEKGITLIALVVTIVILLILAGISMTMVIGENGIIKKAKDARENQVHSAVKEGIILSHNQYTIEDGTGESNSTTFKDYIEGKGIIDENGIINVVNLLGKKQHLGNGSSTETGDVYVFEESDDVYRVKYYDEKKEEHLIDEFEKGSTGEDWAETDPKYFEVDDDGEIYLKYEYWYQYYKETAKWTEEYLVIPEEIDGKKVTKIGGSLTGYMKSVLRKVKIPNTVTVIGDGAFEYCTELEDVIIPDSVTTIERSAFSNCTKLSKIKLPNNLISIGQGAFSNSNLTSLKLPDSLVSLEGFEDCYFSTEIIIPENVTYIGGFNYCDLTDVKIPKNVTLIEGFSQSHISSISVSEENENYDSRNNCNAIIETSTNKLLQGSDNTVLPDTVVSLRDFAFNNCFELKSIMIPEGLVDIPDSAFLGCNNLINISVSSKNKKYDSRNDCNAIIETSTNTLIKGCSKTTIPETVINIGYDAFEFCTELTDIIIPNSVVNIGSYAFLSSGLTSVTIPNSVTNIENGAFAYCEALTSVTMPEGIKMIADDIFSECSKLESITIPNSVWSIGNGAFSNCDSLKTINYTGTVSEWKNIKLSNGNDALTNATIVYNYTPSNQ